MGLWGGGCVSHVSIHVKYDAYPFFSSGGIISTEEQHGVLWLASHLSLLPLSSTFVGESFTIWHGQVRRVAAQSTGNVTLVSDVSLLTGQFVCVPAVLVSVSVSLFVCLYVCCWYSPSSLFCLSVRTFWWRPLVETYGGVLLWLPLIPWFLSFGKKIRPVVDFSVLILVLFIHLLHLQAGHGRV